jgi:hypothetical protein
MRKLTLLLAAAGVMAAVVGASAGQAGVYTSTIPAYNGSGFSEAGPFPQPAVTVGTFTYAIPPGETIVGATISGHFGNSVVPNSAGADVYLNGVLVGRCVRFGACYFGLGAAWSHTFGFEARSLLAGGSAVLTVVQTSEFVIRLAPTTLTIQTRWSPRPPTAPR